MNLERALSRLLCDPAFRARVGARDFTGLDEDAREALADIDMPRVEAAAIAVVREVRGRRHRGVGTLEEMFADVLAHLDEGARSVLFTRFVASRAYAAHGGRGEGRGVSLEEAFARFVIEECEGFAAGVVERCFLRALTRSLAVCPQPSFSVPATLRRRGRGWCAVTEGRFLFAVVDGRAIEGPIDNVLAVMLQADDASTALAAAASAGVSVDDAERLLRELERMGLAPQ